MKYPFEDPYADVFLSSNPLDMHDYYYISPRPIQENSFYYQVNRTGIEAQLPTVFSIKRSAASARCCEIFCILSGEGKLNYRGKQYHLKENQIVLLSDKEEHSYNTIPENPMGNTWIEFYGADSHRIMQHLINHFGPIVEGTVFRTVCAKITAIQQNFMMKDAYQPALDMYDILLTLLNYEQEQIREVITDVRDKFPLVETYIDGHLSQEISNQELAHLCKISLPYFLKRFKAYYHITPQEYIMRRRIVKSKYALVRTEQSIDSIAEALGFCNTSHFIRRFKLQEKMTPAQYRRTYRF